jgi:hypothetical protein
VTWRETLSYTRPMQIGMLMMFFSAMTGINSVIFYSTSIFQSAGVDNPILGTVLVGVLNVIMTTVSGYLVSHGPPPVIMLSQGPFCFSQGGRTCFEHVALPG